MLRRELSISIINKESLGAEEEGDSIRIKPRVFQLVFYLIPESLELAACVSSRTCLPSNLRLYSSLRSGYHPHRPHRPEVGLNNL
jgi:hypothetical protein